MIKLKQYSVFLELAWVANGMENEHNKCFEIIEVLNSLELLINLFNFFKKISAVFFKHKNVLFTALCICFVL